MKRALLLSLATTLALPLSAAEERAPEVTRKGRTVVAYKGPALEAVLGYRWMNGHADATWVPLQFAVSGAGAATVPIAREDVSLVTPSGERIPLPTQKQFLEGLKDPRPIVQELRVTRDPISGYFPGRNTDQRLAFFSLPGERIAWDEVSVNRTVLTWGLLWFPLPGGVRPGTYRLEIRSKWANVEIPFTVPAPPLGTAADAAW